MSQQPLILGLETSCDETAAAILDGDGRVLSSVVASQHDIHARFGGVVPELAARRHIEQVEPVVREALLRAMVTWQDLGAVAVTHGPGLAGALVTGISFGKAIAFAAGLPLLAVNHLEAHLASAWIDQPDFPVPCVVLVVSGGHTHLYRMAPDRAVTLLGRTLDDAAGEAFDKGATMLGLPYPGGPQIDRLARTGNRDAVRFPRPCLRDQGFDFSFSGLKTALLYHLRDLERSEVPRATADLAASYQEAIVEVLVEKAFRAVQETGINSLAIVGGVSANSRLRELSEARAAIDQVRLTFPRLEYCTDNAAMVAAAGLHAYRQGRFATLQLEAVPDLALGAVSRVG